MMRAPWGNRGPSKRKRLDQQTYLTPRGLLAGPASRARSPGHPPPAKGRGQARIEPDM